MIKLIHCNLHFKCTDNSCIIIKDQSSSISWLLGKHGSQIDQSELEANLVAPGQKERERVASNQVTLSSEWLKPRKEQVALANDRKCHGNARSQNGSHISLTEKFLPP